MTLTKIRLTTPTEPFMTKIVLSHQHLIGILLEPTKTRIKESIEADEQEWGIEQEMPSDEEIAETILIPNSGAIDPVELAEWLRPAIAQQFKISEERIKLALERIDSTDCPRPGQVNWVEFSLTIEG